MNISADLEKLCMNVRAAVANTTLEQVLEFPYNEHTLIFQSLHEEVFKYINSLENSKKSSHDSY